MEGRIVLVLISLASLLKVSNGSGLERIINGRNATAKQFPHQVFYDILLPGDRPFWRPTCGGTLISSKLVLTAAHCVWNEPIKALRIYLGAVDKSNANEKGQQRLIVNRKSLVIHEEYDNSFYNDIALIKLPIHVPCNEYIRAARLPPPTNSYVNTKGIVSGWGAYKVSANGEEHFHGSLKYYEINIISNDECAEKRRPVLPGIFPASFICIAPSENSPCHNDSGGPLVFKRGGDFILLGVASHGLSRNCTTNLPTVYTRVSSFLNWIWKHAGGPIGN